MDQDQIRAQILEEFLKNIGCIADEQYQQRVWVRAEGPECNDIHDAVCDFFDDGNPILEKYQDYGITSSQLNALWTLHRELSEFTDMEGVCNPYKSTEKLVQMPKWQEIRNLAKQVLEEFNFHQKSPFT
ncbi:MAG: hypothetical protein WCG10_04085 [Chlamydiota bacterium]